MEKSFPWLSVPTNAAVQFELFPQIAMEGKAICLISVTFYESNLMERCRQCDQLQMSESKSFLIL